MLGSHALSLTCGVEELEVVREWDMVISLEVEEVSVGCLNR